MSDPLSIAIGVLVSASLLLMMYVFFSTDIDNDDFFNLLVKAHLLGLAFGLLIATFIVILAVYDSNTTISSTQSIRHLSGIVR